MAYSRLKQQRVKRIKQQYRGYSFAPALGFTGKFWRAGDFISFMLANKSFGAKYNLNGIYYVSQLHCAAEIEKGTGFFTAYLMEDVLTRRLAYGMNNRLIKEGFFTRVPFPNEISHIIKKRKCYQLSDKGREALRFFRSEYMKHQKMNKKAKLKLLEQINEF